MKCIICKTGATAEGFTTVTMERGKTTIVIKNVPADVCGNCGEPYVTEQTSTRVLEIAEAAVEIGAAVQVQEYQVA